MLEQLYICKFAPKCTIVLNGKPQTIKLAEENNLHDIEVGKDF